MRKTYSEVKYGYRVNIDIEKVIDQIIESLPGDITDISFDEDVMTISGEHRVNCKHWTSPQTLESPAENEIELEYSIEDADVEGTVKEALKLATVSVEMDEPTEVDEW